MRSLRCSAAPSIWATCAPNLSPRSPAVTPLGWIGVWLLLLGVLAIVLQGVLAAIWTARIVKRSRALRGALASEQAKLQAESARLQAALVEKSLQRVRESLADLRPAAISPDGLLGDLRREADDFARLYGIRVELSSNGTEDMLVPHHREVVAQVVREALTNVRRHSGSAICRVRLAFAARPFLVEVSDEGRG